MQKNVEIQQKTFLSSVSGYLDCTHCTPVSLGLRAILGSSWFTEIPWNSNHANSKAPVSFLNCLVLQSDCKSSLPMSWISGKSHVGRQPQCFQPAADHPRDPTSDQPPEQLSASGEPLARRGPWDVGDRCLRWRSLYNTSLMAQDMLLPL